MRLPIRLSPLLVPAILVCVLRVPPALGQAVGPEFRVNTYTTSNQSSPFVASDSAGNFVVVWRSSTQDGSSGGVFGQRYDSAGGMLGGEFRVNTYATNGQGPATVASDSGGNFVVAWGSNTQDGSGDGVFGQRYSSTGAALGTEFRVNTYTTSYQNAPSVASDSGGNFVVVWESLTQDGSLYGVFGQRFGSAGAPLGIEFLVNTYTTSDQRNPSVASDSGGEFVVVWASAALDPSLDIVGQRYSSAGAPLGAEFLVNTYTTGYQGLPSVASDSSGNFVVVWHSASQDGSDYGIFGQRYDSAGASLGTEFRVNTYTTYKQFFPSVASDPNGNFVVVWETKGQDGSSDGVVGLRYSSTGAALGGEFLVNTYTTNIQGIPSVASDSRGHFAVVWQSLGQDGSNYGVFGQRFCPALSSVTIAVNGATTVCTTSTGGVATVTDAGGGFPAHQWGYRTVSGSPFVTPLTGQIGTAYTINGANFVQGAGVYFLVCGTTPVCGTFLFSNEVQVTVTSDTVAPAVTPPPSFTTTQTLCM